MEIVRRFSAKGHNFSRVGVGLEAEHGVSFLEGVSAFSDPRSALMPDPDHSVGEERLLLMGHSYRERLVVVAHAERGSQIRIISARLATRTERQRYEEEA